jgi:type II secretory pathway pseudopilin PulG
MPTGERTAPCRPARRPPCGATRGPRQHGFTYLWLLFALALGGVGLAALGEREQTRQQREREAELRFRGEAIAAALGRYAAATPLGQLPLPQRLDELLNDRRFPKPQRHLRQLYDDPFTGRPDWEPVLGQAVASGEAAASAPARSGIVGVRSRSSRRLFATAGGRNTAHDWVFTAATTAPSTPPE